jgi:signal peptidase II
LWLDLHYNAGLSFSFNAHGATWVSLLLAVVALGIVGVGLRAAPGPAAAGFGLVIGGGVANLIDRLAASPHVVTDFIALSSFPAFNVADICLTIGCVILLVAALRGETLVRP